MLSHIGYAQTIKGGKVDTESAKLNKLQTNNLIKKTKQNN